MNPQLYVLFILALPVNIPGWFLLLLSFFLGLFMDAFSDSLAIHAAASVLMAFCRPAALRVILGATLPEEEIKPGFSKLGGARLVVYSLSLIVIHHSALFFLEIFHFAEAWQTLQRILFSSLLSLVFVLIGFAFLDRSLSS